MAGLEIGDLYQALILHYLRIFVLVAIMVLAATYAGMWRHVRRDQDSIVTSLLVALVLSLVLGSIAAYGSYRGDVAFARGEERRLKFEQQAFAEKMRRLYPLTAVEEERVGPPRIRISFGVPRDGAYDVHVYGTVGTVRRVFDWDHLVVDQRRYGLRLQEGENSLSFAYKAPPAMADDESLDLVLIVVPKTWTEAVTKTKEGFLVVNPGELLMREGINYSSPNLITYYGSCARVFDKTPCVEDKRLRLPLKER